MNKQRLLAKSPTVRTPAQESWKALPLWENQRAALRTVYKYLKSPAQSALVQNPTGTGKTGVMAVLCGIESRTGNVLVLSPSTGLCEQLTEDIRERFWTIINASTWRPSELQRLLPSRAGALQARLKDKSSGIVLIGTFQALTAVRNEIPTLYAALKDKLSLILADEGHREPAREWGAAVRNLAKPTVLFSATPYRNDLRIFNVSRKYISYLSFVEAVSKHLIRNVNFEFLQQNLSKIPIAFAQEVISAFDKLRDEHKIAKDARVIVRCADEDGVRSVFDAFNQALAGRPEKCRAIHHQFESEDEEGLSSAIDLKNTTETFLIHQFKLMEGLDDWRCAVLALYDGFFSDRQTVQQIGRIIRNPTPGQKTTDAYVISTNIRCTREAWNRYLRFDEACRAHGGNPFLRSEGFLDQILDAIPTDDYVGGRFRSRPDFDSPTFFDEIRIAQTAVVFRTKPNFSLKAVMPLVRNAIESDDRIVVAENGHEQDNAHLWLSILLQQSPLLSSSSFPDLKLTATMLKKSGEHLFFYDDAGLYLDDVLDHCVRLRSKELHCLFPEHDSQVMSLSTRNGDISDFAVRSRTITAASLSRSIPFMGDNTNFVSRASGRNSGVRRYIGFSRGRVRDERFKEGSLVDFRRWADSVSGELKKDSRPAALFSRFAVPAQAPADTTPRNILLDLEDLEESFYEGNSKFDTDDVCRDVEQRPDATPKDKYKNQFTLDVNEKQCAVHIRYDPKRKKYLLRSKALDRYVSANESTLTKELNRRQAFRVIPATAGLLYAFRQFYSTDLRLGDKKASSFVVNLVEGYAELKAVVDEKGSAEGKHTSWQAGSLFDLIDKGLTGKKPKFLSGDFSGSVCDDMGSEVADFLAYSKDKVVFVQAKAHSDNPGVSASKLHEICSQAVKNLEYLRFGGRELPGNGQKWDSPWKGGNKRKDGEKSSTYEVKPRIRMGPANAKDFRSRLRDVLIRPNIRREVWIVLGRIFSKEKFEQLLKKTPVEAHALQSFFLLASTFSACKSVGVDLRIICSE